MYRLVVGCRCRFVVGKLIEPALQVYRSNGRELLLCKLDVFGMVHINF
jgi:hypothetical protein